MAGRYSRKFVDFSLLPIREHNDIRKRSPFKQNGFEV